ncbi:MAG: GH92 family glycosyl hydrolase [Bacteroidota bacterium]
MSTRKIVLLFIALSCTIYPQNHKLTEFVNPFIGTSNGGNTFPGAVVPWGMVSVSPHNSPGSPSGYIFGKKYFYGFGHTHLSGTGCADLGGVILTAANSKISFDPEKYKSTYSGEFASPGFYKVKIDEPDIIAEVTATSRCGITKITPLNNGVINLLIDSGRSLAITGGGKIIIKSNTEIEGYNVSGGFCGELNRQTVYFSAQFSEPSIESGILIGDKNINSKTAEVKDSSIGCWMKYKADRGKYIYVKVGISYVSIENARLNLLTEIPGWDFELVKLNAEKLWEENLSRIIVEGDSKEDKIKFYTALYHMLIHPNIINDVNGEYPLMGRGGIGKYSNQNRYTVFSLWDTYRTLHPFLTLVYPERQSEIINTMIDMYLEYGFLPKWELAGQETYMMVGDPAAIVLADSYVKGIKDFNVNAGFDAVLKPADLKNNEDAPPIRAGYHYQLKHGFIPFDQDMTKEWWVWGPVSTSLEYCLSDYAISQFAKKLGKLKEENLFYKRSLFYKNLFDPETKFMRPRLANKDWLIPFDSLATEGSGDWIGSGGPGYVEGSAWNYTWFVPHDIKGLIELFGSEKSFSQKLKMSFRNGQFTINNEPDIAYPYLFNYVKGEEYLTAEYVSTIMRDNFGTDQNGLPGNDDCGTISGWFVFSALGFYPDCPANENYQLGIPLFDKAVIKLNNNYFTGNEFIVEKLRQRDNKERVIELNGNPKRDFTLSHWDIVKGGKIIFK